MSFFRRRFRLGISHKVLLGLAFLVLVAVLSNGVAKHYFDKFGQLFQRLPDTQLPLLISASKLMKGAQELASIDPDIVLTQNPLLLKALAQTIERKTRQNLELIAQLDDAHIAEAGALSEKVQRLSYNLRHLIDIVENNLRITRRTLQLSLHIRQVSEAFLLEQITMPPATSPDRVREHFIRIFSLLREIPTLSDSQLLKEYEGQVLELKALIDEALQKEPAYREAFSLYENTVNKYGMSEEGLLALAQEHLHQQTLIRDKLIENTFLADELMIHTDRIFSTISKELQLQSLEIAEEIGWFSTLFVIIPLVIILSALIIFLFIRHSVIGRILSLERCLKSNIQGKPLPIPGEGDDEIASMAQSMSFFIEKRDEYESSLREAKLAAEKANQAKSMFLAGMSHELRTPMNAVLGFSRLLASSPHSPDEQENIDIIIRSGEHLLTLINQVLELSRIEAGQSTLTEKACDMYRLLDDLEDLFSLKAQQKGLQLLFTRYESVPHFVKTDELKLRQILINLLNNAIKFTPRGSIHVSAEGFQRTEHAGEPTALHTLKFRVKDTGLGIAPEEMKDIFEAFTQTESGRNAQEGTGLGLSISRNFVRLLGGDIQVDSASGKGSTFSFTIQVVSTERIPLDENSSPRSKRVIACQPAHHHQRIAIVDDEANNRALLVKLLQPLGFELREAANGHDAITLWNTWKPHLIWMDLRMPDMNGYQVTKRIFASLSFEDRPPIVIGVTAGGFEVERTMALEAGCRDFLRKPFQASEVFELLHKHLEVEFIYEDTEVSAQQQPARTANLSPGELAALPSDLLRDLEHALITTDMTGLMQLISEIRRHDSVLASTFTRLAGNFKYTAMLTAVQQYLHFPQRDDVK